MPTLHQQVERIAKRGRKRWLGLVFVTQLPQHLPDAILGLVNNFVLHKIGDASVIARLKRSVGGVDKALWSRLPRLAAGQAVVSLASLSRPTADCDGPRALPPADGPIARCSGVQVFRFPGGQTRGRSVHLLHRGGASLPTVSPTASNSRPANALKPVNP